MAPIPRNPHRVAYKVAYWAGCFVLFAFGVALLLLGGVAGISDRMAGLAGTAGGVLIGTSASLLATALMELATLKTAVAELDRIFGDATAGVLGSPPAELDRGTYSGRLHHYSKVITESGSEWQYTEIVFERVHAARVLGFGTWLSKEGEELVYKIELGVRESRTILVFQAVGVPELPTIEVYPFPRKSFRDDVQCGIAFDRGWDGTDHVGLAILSWTKLHVDDNRGFLLPARATALDALWQANFKSKTTWTPTCSPELDPLGAGGSRITREASS